MTATQKTSSVFERAARRKKVAALAAHVTELVALLYLTPERDGYLIAELLRGWGDPEWRSAAINVGGRPPSVETRLAVLAHFINAQRRKETT